MKQLFCRDCGHSIHRHKAEGKQVLSYYCCAEIIKGKAVYGCVCSMSKEEVLNARK